MRAFLRIIASSAILVACSQAEEAPRELFSIAQSPIEGGAVDSSDTNVLGVVHFDGFSFGACTGSLLSPNVVLSAIHCVAPTPQTIDCDSVQVGATYPPGEMYVTTQTTISQDGSDYLGVSQVRVPPGTGLCGRDVSLLILQSPIAATVATPREPRLDPLAPNEIYDAVGYGEQGEGGPSGTRMRRNGLFVACVGAGCGAPQFIYPEEWVGEDAVCSGDSGGPALDAMGRVTGVASRGAQNCDDPVYGDVFSHADFIRQTTIEAAQLAGIPAPPWTESGEGGAGGGVGGGSVTSNWRAGSLEDNDIDGEVQSSCSAAPSSRAADAWWVALAMAALLRRRRG